MADLSNVVRMLIHQLDATRSYLLPGYCDEDDKARAVIAFAESALAAEPPAPGPADHVPDAGNMVAADGEAEELATLLAIGSSCAAGAKLSPEQCRRAAAMLREARPQPVPVAERPWKRPGWCDAEGQCWWGRCADDFFSPEWTMATLASIEEFCSEAMPQHCLPHWAIPQPPQANTTHPTPTEPPTND